MKVSHWPELVGLEGFLQLAEFQLLILDIVGAEKIRDVELRRGSFLDAYLAAIQRQRGVDVARRRNHESCAVIIGDRRKIQIVSGFARHAPCRVARENIDLAVLQLLEALVGIERYEFRLFRIVKDRRRDGATEIDVEAGPVALVVGDREARQAGVDATQHFAALDRPLQGSGIIPFVGDGRSRDRDCDRQPDQEAASECPHGMYLSSNDRETIDALKASGRITVPASAAR